MFGLPKRNHPHVVFIHGANATPKGFNYIVENTNVDKDNCTFVLYRTKAGVYNNLEILKKKLSNIGPFFAIAHSHGGVYALHLTQWCNIVGVVSIATPFGGGLTAEWLKYFLSSTII